jgi:hypothetical protein
MRGVVFCLVLVAGCTSGPPALRTSAPPAVTPAALAATGAGTTPGSTAEVAANAALADAAGRPVNRALVAQGYRPTTYRGQLFYCRKEKLTGSQFTQKVCVTEQEAALQERIAQDEMNKRNWAGKCLPPLCPKK